MIRFPLFFILVSAVGLTGPATAENGPGPIATAHDVRLDGDRRRTRFAAELSEKVPISVFTLADPYRVVIDLPEVAFSLPAESGRHGHGLVAAYRFGRFAPGKSRIVLDAAGPVRVAAAFVTDPEGKGPARLVVELRPTDRAGFLRMVARNRPPERPRTPAPPPAKTSRPTVVLDPGHGGIDPGTLGHDGIAEKTIVLEMAETLKARLERSGRIRVILTRTDDRFVPLDERVRIARENRAALFVSLHADSIDVAEVRGATVYVLSDTASDSKAAALAAKENRADILAGVALAEPGGVVSDILTDLTRRETHNLSATVAKVVISQLEGTARLNKNPFRAAGFRVLRAPDVPSILLELGYLSNRKDAQNLTSKAWRKRIAEALADAIGTALSHRTAHIP